jgi:hypothetical protein
MMLTTLPFDHALRPLRLRAAIGHAMATSGIFLYDTASGRSAAAGACGIANRRRGAERLATADIEHADADGEPLGKAANPPKKPRDQRFVIDAPPSRVHVAGELRPPMSGIIDHLGKHLPRLVKCFREGGGIPYSEYQRSRG